MRRVALLLFIVSLPCRAAAGLRRPSRRLTRHASRRDKWGPASPALPPGAQMAVLAGDPGSEGPFVIRIKLPAGYRVPPHWHPVDEHVTIISGTLQLGMGDKFDAASMRALTGRFVRDCGKGDAALRAGERLDGDPGQRDGAVRYYVCESLLTIPETRRSSNVCVSVRRVERCQVESGVRGVKW